MSPRLLPIFTVSFAVVYSLVFFLRMRYLVYYPKSHVWRLALDPNQPQPGMYYYGWIVMGTLGALLVCLLCTPFIDRVKWSVSSAWVWIIPLIAVPFLAVVYGYRFNLW
ncbi:MAG TPA: hypothetical protein VN577_22935 [Terriglobales bacterium]|nr:hypothetical protein [Terriglobales bacterium]